MIRIMIVGGGIAGLSAAYYAKKRLPDSRIMVIESNSYWGGKIATERIASDAGQFIIEGGPDSFLASKPWGIALCEELGLGERLHGTNPKQKNTYILHKGCLLPLPDGLAMMIPTNIRSILGSRLLSWLGKARMGLDLFLPAKADHEDESLGGFVSRRLGREAYENLIEPLMSGIYAGDGNRLSLASAFPSLRSLELRYGSLVRGAMGMRKQSHGKALQGSRSAFHTPTTGLAEIVEKLVECLSSNGVVLRLNTRAISIEPPTTNTWRVTLDPAEVLETDYIILAAPAYASGSLVASFDAGLSSVLQSIPYVSTATVSLAYRLRDIPRGLDGYGYVIPRREGRRALACTWTSTKFSHRAPEGYALLRVFLGRAGQDVPWDEDELLKLAMEELNQTLHVTAEPIISRLFLWDKAMPQYNLGHEDKLKQIDIALEKYPGLTLAGNGYRGIGIPDCIRSGEEAAERALAFTRAKAEALQLLN